MQKPKNETIASTLKVVLLFRNTTYQSTPLSPIVKKCKKAIENLDGLFYTL
jgi:hypothetical protein